VTGGTPVRGETAHPDTAHLSRRRRWRRRGYALLARGVLGLLRRLPEPAGRGLCRALAALAWRIRPRERRLAERNVALVFPDHAPARRRRLLLQARRRLADNLYVTATLPARVRRGLPEVADPDGVLAAARRLQDEGHGLIVLTGHFSCWELLGAWLARGLGGLTAVTATIRNPPVDRLVNGWRRTCGLTPVPRRRGLAPLAAALRRGEAVVLLPDQALAAADLTLPFCGRPAPTVSGPARLALLTGAPLLPVALARRATGGPPAYRVVMLSPLRPAGSGPEAVTALAAAMNAALSELLLRNPAEWVWFHDRWRLRDDPTLR